MVARASINERIEEARRAHAGARIDCYVLFESHTDAMQLYTLAKAAGLAPRISATPRQARSSCGVALLVDAGQAQEIEAVALEGGVPFEDIVPLPNQIDPNRDVYC